jgi:pimeloyl-ACP methyl ester carboxylesterase
MSEAAAQTLDNAIGPTQWQVPPPGVEPIRYRVPSGELAGWVAGPPQGPRVVLVPGATGSKEDFALMIPLLARAGFRVEAIDLAGQFESADAGPEHLDPPRTRYDQDLFVGDVIAVLRSGRMPAHLLGYSFAGTVVQVAAVRFPALVASLTLLTVPPVSGHVFRKASGYSGLLSLASFLVGPRGAAGILAWGIRTNRNHVDSERHGFVMRRLAVTRWASVVDIFRLMAHTPELAEEVRALPIPKLVAFGTHDLWSSRAHRRYAERIGAEAAEYATGHSPCETAPHQLVRDMVRVMSKAA